MSYKVKLEGELFDNAKKCAEKSGYASVDEFVMHAVEKEIKRVMPDEGGGESKETVKKRLQGLGYIE